MSYTIDIEPTNRCNASCHFCPRDMTPHEGLMSEEVFDQALSRAIEYREVVNTVLEGDVQISLCGLGEPLINPRLPSFVAKVREAGFHCSISSNAAILDERRAAALLDAGVQAVFLNVGEIGDEYEAVYKLPFDRTRHNAVRFAELAGDRCEVHMVLVDHRRDAEHLEKMRAYWRAEGMRHFVVYDIINRGGSLFVDHMQFQNYRELGDAQRILHERAGGVGLCGAPLGYLFIGYDGQYYLCCSDWTKQTPMGSVFDESFLSVTRQKLEHVKTRQPVCVTCNLDPTNRLVEELRARNEGASDAATTEALIEEIVRANGIVNGIVDRLEPHLPNGNTVSAPRRLIPLSSD